MKNYKIHIAVVNALILISMFFAYQVLSEYESYWKGARILREGNLHISGFNLPEVYGILGGSLFISLISLSVRNLATAIIGTTLSLGLVLYALLVALMLTFALFDMGDELGIGYYIGFIAIIYLVVIQISNLVSEVKIRKRKRILQPKISEDLLDDF